MDEKDILTELDKLDTEPSLPATSSDSTLPSATPVSAVEELIADKTKEALKSADVQKLGQVAARANIRADMEAEAAKLRAKQTTTAESEFATDLRAMKLEHARAEETKRHRYRMSQVDKDSRHLAMLDKRIKMIEKYGYLYKKDEHGNPIDFSYSVFVNVMRTLARNFNKLDTTFRNVLKIIFWGGLVTGAIVLLKHFGIIN